jgi:hypothetical protein
MPIGETESATGPNAIKKTKVNDKLSFVLSCFKIDVIRGSR